MLNSQRQRKKICCEAIVNNFVTTTLTDKISNKVLPPWHARNNNYTCLTTNGFHHHLFRLDRYNNRLHFKMISDNVRPLVDRPPLH